MASIAALFKRIAETQDKPKPKEGSRLLGGSSPTGIGMGPRYLSARDKAQGPSLSERSGSRSTPERSGSAPAWIDKGAWEKDSARKKQKDEEEVSARSKTRKALGTTREELGGFAKLVPEPTFEEVDDKAFAKMSPQQKAAIEYNTMLRDAVERDRAAGGKASDAPEQYAAATKEMFGKDRGSEIHAPETVALLKQLGINDKGADLDDYLNMDAAISSDDLKALDTAPATPQQKAVTQMFGGGLEGSGVEAPGAARTEYMAGLASKTAQLTESLIKGRKLLDGVGSSLYADRSQDVLALGGTAREPAANAVDPETKALYDDAFNTMAINLEPADRAELMEQLNQQMSANPKQWEQFWQYSDQRLRTAESYGTGLGVDEQVEKDFGYIKPEEFRKLFKMNGG